MLKSYMWPSKYALPLNISACNFKAIINFYLERVFYATWSRGKDKQVKYNQGPEMSCF